MRIWPIDNRVYTVTTTANQTFGLLCGRGILQQPRCSGDDGQDGWSCWRGKWSPVLVQDDCTHGTNWGLHHKCNCYKKTLSHCQREHEAISNEEINELVTTRPPTPLPPTHLNILCCMVVIDLLWWSNDLCDSIVTMLSVQQLIACGVFAPEPLQLLRLRKWTIAHSKWTIIATVELPMEYQWKYCEAIVVG